LYRYDIFYVPDVFIVYSGLILLNILYFLPRRRWEDGIRMVLREIGWWVLEWIDLARDRDRWRAVVNVMMNLRVLAPQS
jgi:hypothetical protein